MNLTVKKAVAYHGNFPVFREPSEIGYFSLDSDRNFHDDSHQLKYLSAPPATSELHLDLNKGYASVIKKEFGKIERIDNMLKWILAHLQEVKKKFRDPHTSKIKIDFVCFRGLLTSICATIYENKEDWLVCATKYKSVIYLCAFDTEQAIERRNKMSERDELMSSWGYKFEQYMTCDTKGGTPVTSVPVNEKEEYCIMLKGRLNNCTLLYSAEVDGEDPAYFLKPENDPTSTRRYIELKTSRIITTDRQDKNFCRYKLLKWWIQSFLVGIPKVICGFRDDSGIVKRLHYFRVSDIPKMAENLWSPSACLNFCSRFLDYIRECVIQDDPYTVYKFYWKPGCDIICEELSSPSEYQILPDWYISNVNF